jgi:hypothetical protein
VLAGCGVDPGWPEDEVEVPGYGLGNRLDAAGAEDLELALVGGAEADVLDLGVRATLFVVVLDDEVGLTLYGQWRYLACVLAVVEDARSDDLVDLKGLVEELNGSDEHGLRVGLCGGGVKYRFAVRTLC